MRRLRFGAFGCVAVTVGCSGGSGPVVLPSTPGRDEPPGIRDTPPSTRDAVDQCLVCDVPYNCVAPGSSPMIGLSLTTDGGTCTQAAIDLVCSGFPFGVTSCTGGGGGPFTCGSTTCTPVLR